MLAFIVIHDEVYFFNSITKFEGFCKFTEIKSKPLLIYKFDLTLDTTGNAIVPKTLFHPDSVYVGDTTKFSKAEYVTKGDLLAELGIPERVRYKNKFVDQAMERGTYPYLITRQHFDSKVPKFSSNIIFHLRTVTILSYIIQ